MFDNTCVVYLLLARYSLQQIIYKLVFCISNDISTFLGQISKLGRQAGRLKMMD